MINTYIIEKESFLNKSIVSYALLKSRSFVVE